MVLQLNDNHSVELYDSLQELPASLESKMQGYMMQEVGIGGKPYNVLHHIQQALLMIDKNPTGAKVEIENAHFAYQNAIDEYSPKNYGWACLIKSIDGGKVFDYGEEALKRSIVFLSGCGLSEEMISESLELVKKNLMGKIGTISPNEVNEELTLYNDMENLFP